MYSVFVYDLMNLHTLVCTASIMVKSHSPAIGIMKITNPVTIIFNASEPEASLNIRLAIPVRAKMNARIPIITLETLFRKIQTHWIIVSATAIGSKRILAIIFSTIIKPPLPFDWADSRSLSPGPRLGELPS